MPHRTGVLAVTAVLLLGCTGRTPPPTGPGEGPVGVCANPDGALSDAAFVIATAPAAGSRVSSGFAVRGCSRTFESTVNWRLLATDGSVLADGFAMGGGVDGPGDFAFAVAYAVTERQLGHLEVFEEDMSDGEGSPPGRTVLPLVLQP